MLGVTTVRATFLIAILFVSQSQCQNEDLNVDEVGSGDDESGSLAVPRGIEFDEASTPAPAAACPSSCLCSQVGETITIDCSGLGLTAIPENMLEEVTELILHNNQIANVPAFISNLKALETLDLSDNAITELEFGSVSELSKLRRLNLSNNKLNAYPQELRNAMDLVNLVELDISGNDLSEQAIASHDFSLLENLKVVILPTATDDLKAELCTAQSKLERVCEGACSDASHVCPAAADPEPPTTAASVATTADGASTPGTADVQESPIEFAKAAVDLSGDAPPEVVAQSTASPDITSSPNPQNEIIAGPGRSAPDPIQFDLAADKPALLSEDKPNLLSAPIVKNVDHDQVAIAPPIQVADDDVVEPKSAEVNANRGGVSNTVIVLVIVAMVALVAGVTIKKNWKSIKNRFNGGGSERPTADVTKNGTAAEEIPLQDKSPAQDPSDGRV